MDTAALYSQIDLPSVSMLATVVILFVMLPAAAATGYWTGASQRRMLLSQDREIDHVVGETTLGAILALLGLLLAFSFGNALNLSQFREAALIEEANALGTAFLRADYLSEPGRTELQTALLDYARTRVVSGEAGITGVGAAQDFLRETLAAQGQLWPLTLQVTADPLPAPLKTHVSGAVNDVLDAHFVRVQTLSTPVSDMVSLMLFASALTSLFLLGNRAGILGRAMTWRTLVFSAFLFIVMITIVDTQRPYAGMVQTDDIALRATIFDMETALANRE